jgi:hypothetical protein
MNKVLILIGVLCLVSLVSADGLTVSVRDTTGAPGDTVNVPIELEGASDVGSMSIVLRYDPDVLMAVAVEGDELGKNAMIEVNTAREGEVIIALADSSGINGDGAAAIISFEVTGDIGSTSPLTLETVSVSNVDMVEIITTTKSGTFSVEDVKLGDAGAAMLPIAAIIIALFISRRRKW